MTTPTFRPSPLLLLATSALALACTPTPKRTHGLAQPRTDAPAPSCTPGSGPDFSGKTLINEDFTSYPAGSLVGANFNGANLSGAVFTGQDLSGASFQAANLGPTDSGRASFAQANLSGTCFAGAILNQTDFNYAQLSCTDFRSTSLMAADFGPMQSFLPDPECRTNFAYATLDVQAIDTANWGLADFSYANFQDLDQFSLAGIDITGAILVGVDFTNLDMSGANLTGVDFSYASLTGANLENAALNAAKLVDADAAYATLSCARFYYDAGDGTDLNAAICTKTPATTIPNVGADLRSVNWANAQLDHATLDQALLNQANLSGANLSGATLRQASLEATGSLNAATIAGTSLTNAVFDEAALDSVIFASSNLTGASFVATTLAHTSFAGSIMPDVDFSQATLESIDFSGTILQNANFTNATIKSVPNGGGSGVSFSCAQLGGSNFTDATVTQATFANAVMPGADDCCAPVAGFTWCGTIDSTGQSYGPVIYPVLESVVTCPDGQNAECQGEQWQLSSNWTTTYCNSYNSIETMWSPPPCGTPPGEIVQFADPNLEQCVLDSLPGDPSSITVATAAQQLELYCAGREIADLGGLESFTGLQVLDLGANNIATFDFSMPALRQLELDVNALTSLDLSGVPNVVWLDVSDNQLSSLTGLANVYFEILDVSNNVLPSLDLSTQTSLVSANLSHNKITSVTDHFNPDLSRLRELVYLDLSYNGIDTIGSVATISFSSQNNAKGSLKTLLLACNSTFACSDLDLDGSYPAYQTSECADFNSMSNTWIPNTYPNCPN
jgi:uncharacterized protein YjbI with pentapeptide repeats